MPSLCAAPESAHAASGVATQVLCDLGYSAMDIITTLFRVVRSFKAEEFLKLEYIKVRTCSGVNACCPTFQTPDKVCHCRWAAPTADLVSAVCRR